MSALTKLVNLVMNSAYGFPPKLPSNPKAMYDWLQKFKKGLRDN